MAEDDDQGIWIGAVEGLYRLFGGGLEKVGTEGGIPNWGITRVAKNTLLTVFMYSGQESADLVRISKAGQGWKAEVVQHGFPRVWLTADHDGEVFFACEGVLCSISADDVLQWQPGEKLKITRHPELYSAEEAKSDSQVRKDRYDCIWVRSALTASYQCPSDKSAHILPSSVASLGQPLILEMSDGSIVLPGYAQVAIGRPGHFRVITTANGYPGAASAIVAQDGTIWFSGSRGLFTFSPHVFMEFWSEREGLTGNTWSVLPLPAATLAIAGDTIVRLTADRSRWQILYSLQAAIALDVGPGSTVMAASRVKGLVQLAQDGKVLRRSTPDQAVTLIKTPDGRYWSAGRTISTVAFEPDRLVLRPESLPGSPTAFRALRIDRDGDLWTCGTIGPLRNHANQWSLISTTGAIRNKPCQNLGFDARRTLWYSYRDTAELALVRDPGTSRQTSQIFDAKNIPGVGFGTFLATDRRGWLWRGGPDGVYVADLPQAEKGEWLHLSYSDGLPAVDTNLGSFREDADGSVWFGADYSIIHMVPSADLVRPNYAPSVFISAFSQDGRSPELAAGLGEVKSGTSLIAYIGSLQMDRRNALHIRYRLLPKQVSWQETNLLDLGLGSLPWGSQTLEVQAQLGSGPWSPVVRQTFTVLKPIWFTWPVLLGFTGIGVAVGTVSTARYKRRVAREKKSLPDLAEWRLATLVPEGYELVGTCLDERFDIERILARGGFATVFGGRDRNKGTECAIKVFRRELVGQAWLERQFWHEVTALESISHPNVVQIYGHGTVPGGAPYLAMEFVDGRTLREILDNGALPHLEVAALLRQAGCALDQLHALEIYHRDLKPENIMVRNHGEPRASLVLIDFSIAIIKNPDESIHGLSRAAGTLYYMAPEQVLGYADASSDIYSLAKILIEMLSGRPLSVLLPDASLDLSQRLPGLLKQLQIALSHQSIAILCAALEYDPAKRPQHAAQFANLIAEDLASQSEQA